MSEDMMNRLMMIAGMCLAVISAVGTVTLLVMCAMDFTVALAVGGALAGATTVGFGWATVYFGSEVSDHHPLVFTNDAEREVLSQKQRKELKKARGEVVMERALIEVEQERDNITHRQIQAANDPDKPPHSTRWTADPKEMEKRAIEAQLKRDRAERGY